MSAAIAGSRHSTGVSPGSGVVVEITQCLIRFDLARPTQHRVARIAMLQIGGASVFLCSEADRKTREVETKEDGVRLAQ